VEVSDGEHLELAGLSLTVRHAPGHTEGSVMFSLGEVPDGVAGQVDVDATVLSGDVLFAGSIGRTDLPGGDGNAMQRSLRDVVLPLPDSTLVLPGHGPATTVEHERATNPYLQGL
jgi:glyoxylase-like metal-dependent hydrolase (beta-lactamase superfamily II)